MKKNILFFIPLLLLSSCTSNNDPKNVEIQKSLISNAFSSKTYFLEAQRSENDQTGCYIMSLFINNSTGSSYTLSKNDLKLNFDNKDNDCLFIVDKYVEKSISDSQGDVVLTRTYVETSSTEKVYESKVDEFQNLWVAFEVKPTDENSFKLTFKGEEVKDLPSA